MIDSFLAEVISYDSLKKTAEIEALVLMNDGSKQTLPAKPVFGIVPKPGNVVLVLAIRNNLDNEAISIFYKPTWANSRIIAVVSENSNEYHFKGNYFFEGDLEIDGKLKVTKDLTVEGKSTFKDEATFKKLATFEQDAKFGILGISFLNHKHFVTAPGTNTGTPLP